MNTRGPLQGIVSLNLPHDTSALIGGSLDYLDDHSYGAFITSTASGSFDFSKTYITRFGYFLTCDQFNDAFTDFARRQGGTKPVGTDQAAKFCADDGQGGCRCDYIAESDAAGSNLTGTWTTSGPLLTHFENSMILPSQVDYCAEGDHLRCGATTAPTRSTWSARRARARCHSRASPAATASRSTARRATHRTA